MNQESLGRRLRQERKDKGMTAEEMASQCDTSASFISLVENGKKIPRLTTFIKMCNALGVSADHLLADSLDEPDHMKPNDLWIKMRELSPLQLEVVAAVIDTLEKQNMR